MKMDDLSLTAFFFRDRLHSIVAIERVQVRRELYDPYYDLDTFRAILDDGVVCELVRTGDDWILETVWGQEI